jgi:ATP-dependent DNA helicase RecG
MTKIDLSGKGIQPEGIYVQQGASSVPASETTILNMIKETSGDCYEDARFLNQQLTFDKEKAYFASHGLSLEGTAKTYAESYRPGWNLRQPGYAAV